MFPPFPRSSGNTKHVRRLFERALTKADDGEAICVAWIAYEREAGSLQALEHCLAQVEDK